MRRVGQFLHPPSQKLVQVEEQVDQGAEGQGLLFRGVPGEPGAAFRLIKYPDWHPTEVPQR